MNTYEVGPDKPVMPSISFLYGDECRIAGEMTPRAGPIVRARIDGAITAEQYFTLSAKEAVANQELRDFMYGNGSPDFMPKIPRVSRWHGWLKNIIN